MTKQMAMNFIEAVKNDTSLRMKLSQLAPDDIDGVIDIAVFNGYTFSRRDYLDAVKEFQQSSAGTAGAGSLRIPGFR